MTEDEARMKRCPLEGCGKMVLADKYIGMNGTEYFWESMCVASDCMSWDSGDCRRLKLND